MAVAIHDDKTAMPVSLSPNSLGKTTSHSTRLQTTAAKSLVIPQAGERDADSLREFHVNGLHQTPKLSPQPHSFFTFGLLNLNP